MVLTQKNNEATAIPELLLENQFIKNLTYNFSRHPDQCNRISQSDAEIICIDESQDNYLVGKIDGIHEEINCGLYTDPFMIGWMAVTATLSDLAAVGATPTGIMLLLQLSPLTSKDYLSKITLGIESACKKYGTYVIGGDTNMSTHLSVAVSAIGSILGSKPITRKGSHPGDYLYTTGKPGAGTNYAYEIFFRNHTTSFFQPTARLKESLTIRKYASACIDSSDGFIPALANLSEINNLGFNIETPMSGLLCEQAFVTSNQAGLPPWLMLSGPHGDYELVFTIPEEKNEEFLAACSGNPWQPLYVGRAIESPVLQLRHNETRINFWPATVANLFSENQGNIPSYFKALLKLHQSLTKKNISNAINHP